MFDPVTTSDHRRDLAALRTDALRRAAQAGTPGLLRRTTGHAFVRIGLRLATGGPQPTADREVHRARRGPRRCGGLGFCCLPQAGIHRVDSRAEDPRVRLRRTRGTPLKRAGQPARSGQTTRSRRSNVSSKTKRPGHLCPKRFHEGGAAARAPTSARPDPRSFRDLPPPQAGDQAAEIRSCGSPLRELASGICPASGVAGPGDRARGIHSVDSPPAKQAEVGPERAGGPALFRGLPLRLAQPGARDPPRRNPLGGFLPAGQISLRDSVRPCTPLAVSPSRCSHASTRPRCTAAPVSTSSTSPGSSPASPTSRCTRSGPTGRRPPSRPSALTAGGRRSPTARVTPTRSRRWRSTWRWRQRSATPTSSTATRGTHSSAGTSRSSCTTSRTS